MATDGSIDWFCAPRFDAPACLAALLGTAAHEYEEAVAGGDGKVKLLAEYQDGYESLEFSGNRPEIHEAIADIHVLQGDYAEAIHGYETAAALTEQPERVDRKLGALYLRRGDYDLAGAHLTDALERSNGEMPFRDVLKGADHTSRLP